MNSDLLLKKAAEALDTTTYRARFERTVAAGLASAEGEPPVPPAYTKLNLARTRRIEKTLKVPQEVQVVLATAVPQTWLVITEEWCGDSAQSLPVMQALAAMAPAITVGILLRLHHADLMDHYLTNGARSIPRLVAIDPVSGRELFNWGPRPAGAQAVIMDERKKQEAERKSADDLAEALHGWYAANKGQDICAEIAALVRTSR